MNAFTLSRALILLMATATGLAVASNYYAQPLLHSIAEQFGLSTASAGSIVIAAQLSYGAGLLLLAPLGDLFEQRRLITVMTAISTLGLVISACAPSLPWLILGTALTGLFSVVAQILVPMAATLSEPHQRGRAVSTLMSGLLLGILLARTAAGFMAELGGWRSIYVLAAVLMAITALALYRSLPQHHSHAGLKYPALIASVFRLFFEEPVLRLRSLLGLLAFSLLALFWTPLACVLAQGPYECWDAGVGVVGVAGAGGAG
jgi:predicted MFS family arabinose efflux permease